MRATLPSTVVCVLAAIAVADDTHEVKLAREAHASWVNVRADTGRAAPDRYERPSASSVNREVFATAFDDTDFATWDVDDDRELLADGLFLSVERGLAAPDADRAVLAGETFLLLFGDEPDAPLVRGLHLPLSRLAIGDAAGALAGVREPERGLGYEDWIGARLLCGDLLAATGGDPLATQTAYSRAFHATEFPPARQEPETDDERLQNAAYAERIAKTRRMAKLRIDLVGQPLPALAPTGGTRGLGRVLNDSEGRVVVAFLFAPGNREHLAALLHLDDVVRDTGDGKVSVYAATWFENAGARIDNKTRELVMPEGPDELRGVPVEIRPTSLAAQMRKLAKALDLSFPIGVVKESVAQELTADALDGVVVVADTDHDVAIVTTPDDARRFYALLRVLLAREALSDTADPE